MQVADCLKEIKNGDGHSVIVVDDFYIDPSAVRNFALSQKYKSEMPVFPGFRTEKTFYSTELHSRLSRIIKKDFDWGGHYKNGSFQFITSGGMSSSYIHSDGVSWAGVLYLSEGHDGDPGTDFYHYKECGHSKIGTDCAYAAVRDKGSFDKWSLSFTVPFRFNRLVFYPGEQFHRNSKSWGETLIDSRLTQVFFIQ